MSNVHNAVSEATLRIAADGDNKALSTNNAGVADLSIVNSAKVAVITLNAVLADPDLIALVIAAERPATLHVTARNRFLR